MRIILAQPRGFCAGVNMAIEALDRAVQIFGSEIYVYHEIVHNQHVVQQYVRQGVKFVNEIEDVPAGSVLLYSAHGTSPEVRKRAQKRRLQTIDATCPLVTKVHLEAARYAREGYHIVLIGHQGHDEVIGTLGEAPDRIWLVETPEDVDELPFAPDAKVAYLTQTTLSLSETARIVERLTARYPHIESPKKDDICYATTNRQQAVLELAPEADLVLVLGSQNSSNSRRLMELAQSLGKPSYLVDGVAELSSEWFAGVETVLITAGASAPEVVVQECVDHLVATYDARCETVATREENVEFPLPKELRVLQNGSTM